MEKKDQIVHDVRLRIALRRRLRIALREKQAFLKDFSTLGSCLCFGVDSGHLAAISKLNLNPSFLLPRTPLTMGHLWQLPKELRSSSILANFEPKWEKVKRDNDDRQEQKRDQSGPGVSLLPALSKTFASQLLLVALLELLTLFCWQVIAFIIIN